MTTTSKKLDQLALLAIDCAMAVISQPARKAILKKRHSLALKDERELTLLMQNHKDDFTSFIWKRRMASKRSVRSLHQGAMAAMGRVGDLISDSSLESINTFEKTNMARLLKDVINTWNCEQEDVMGALGMRACLALPRISRAFKLSANRLEAQLLSDDTANNAWHCIYGSCGPWALKSLAKPFHKDLVAKTMEQLKTSEPDTHSYVHLLARTLDLIHPSHQLQAQTLGFPLYAAQILRKRIQALGYELPAAEESNAAIEYKLTIDLIKQIDRRLDKDLNCYFEVMVPFKASYRIGFHLGTAPMHQEGYPGQDCNSFGIDSFGCVHADKYSLPYVPSLCDAATFGTSKQLGLLVDMYLGNIHLVCNNTILPPAFGSNAEHFAPDECERQKYLYITLDASFLKTC